MDTGPEICEEVDGVYNIIICLGFLLLSPLWDMYSG